MRGCDVWCGRGDESVGGGGMSMSGWAVVYEALCMLVVRDLRSGDDGDHLGECTQSRPTGRLGNSNQPVRRLASLTPAPHSHRDPCSLSQLNLHSNTTGFTPTATLKHRLTGRAVSLRCIADRTRIFVLCY